MKISIVSLSLLGLLFSPPALQAQLLPAISDVQAQEIGKRIWQNECGGTVGGLTSWNVGEEFPSLGIGHFIWYRKEAPQRFEESFPPMLAYLQSRGAKLPEVLVKNKSCPWPSREAFLAAQNSPDMVALRNFLRDTVPLQAAYMAQRFEQSLAKILDAAPASGRTALTARIRAVAATPQGIYALMDYVNFKGEGLRAEERYNGQGWGLLQVLEEMRDSASGIPARQEFSRAAIGVLKRRVANSPPARGEQRWMEGWQNRCLTYR
jgi:hypothetical protein